MWSSFRESRDKLVKELRCTLEFAEGYLDGKMYRRHQMELSERFRDGMDEYAKGFRTGYYMLACSLPTEVNRETPAELEV
jgi:hypothetical protein